MKDYDITYYNKLGNMALQTYPAKNKIAALRKFRRNHKSAEIIKIEVVRG